MRNLRVFLAVIFFSVDGVDVLPSESAFQQSTPPFLVFGNYRDHKQASDMLSQIHQFKGISDRIDYNADTMLVRRLSMSRDALDQMENAVHQGK